MATFKLWFFCNFPCIALTRATVLEGLLKRPRTEWLKTGSVLFRSHSRNHRLEDKIKSVSKGNILVNVYLNFF